MTTGTRCPTCGHAALVHYKDGACPRWAIKGLEQPAIRVMVRVGSKRWYGCTDHILAFFVDYADQESGMVPTRDLHTDEMFDAPIWTTNSSRGWTARASSEQRAEAKDAIEQAGGERVLIIAKWAQR